MPKTLLSVGHPNAGKSTLFNGLTGGNAKVGNWGGVTVDRKIGQVELAKQTIDLVDLPGFYDLTPIVGGPEDERVSQNALLTKDYDGIVNVVDANALERHLYLTVQLRELGVPMVVLLNKWDQTQQVNIDFDALAQRLGCPVIPVSAREQGGIASAKAALTDLLDAETPGVLTIPYDADIEKQLGDDRSGDLLKLLAEDTQFLTRVATSRQSWIAEQVQASVTVVDDRPTLSERLDRIVLNPFAGVPIFLAMMYLMFMFAIHVGSSFIDFFDIMAGAIFVDGTALALESVGAPAWMTALLSSGIGAGIQTVATFIPVVAFLFIALGVMETSGYLSRAAFVIEGLMQKLGLPGKAFVPLIVGFGCNVPSITATRTLELKRQRIMTSMMAPFMSCGARLPVYALFAAAFFQDSGQNLVFALYLIGIVMAILTGLFLRYTLLPGNSGTTVMELPNYEVPSAAKILSSTWMRTRQFVVGAGKVIVVVVTLLSFLNTMGTDGTLGHEDSETSLLSSAAQVVTPVFSPMGIEEDNWPATVGIVTGIFAKEAVVGTLSNLYTDEAGEEGGEWDLLASLNEALATIPEALLGIAVSDPLGLDLGDTHNLDEMADAHGFATSSLDNIAKAFGTTAAAMAYLLFILLYTPCAAVLGAIAGELGGRWAGFSAAWTFFVAYASATLFYQFSLGGAAAFGYLALFAAILVGLFIGLRRLGQRMHNSAGDIPVIVQS